MIHHRPICFFCERTVEYDPVFSPPLCEHSDCGSAVFHGLCLMEWRERRDEALVEAKQAFVRHLNGDCSCQE